METDRWEFLLLFVSAKILGVISRFMHEYGTSLSSRKILFWPIIQSKFVKIDVDSDWVGLNILFCIFYFWTYSDDTFEVIKEINGPTQRNFSSKMLNIKTLCVGSSLLFDDLVWRIIL